MGRIGQDSTSHTRLPKASGETSRLAALQQLLNGPALAAGARSDVMLNNIRRGLTQAAAAQGDTSADALQNWLSEVLQETPHDRVQLLLDNVNSTEDTSAAHLQFQSALHNVVAKQAEDKGSSAAASPDAKDTVDGTLDTSTTAIKEIPIPNS